MKIARTLGFVLVAVVGTGCGQHAQVEVRKQPFIPGQGAIEDADRKVWEGDGGEVLNVTDHIWVATRFDLGNSIMVTTDDGLVIIDTTSKRERAERVLAAFREITQAPIRTVIYTHAHDDHAGGGKAFAGPGVQVIAQRRWLEKRARDVGWLGPRIIRSRAIQLGIPLPRGYNVPAILGDPAPPTLLVDEEYALTQGEVQFRLFHAPSETFDHLLVWVPQWRVAFTGDAFYASFPNLASPMIPTRDVHAWIESLGRIIDLEPEIVVPSHGPPLVGAATVREVLTNYRDAIAYVWDETIRGINRWQTEDELAHSIRLPQRLAELPYLQERYGTVPGSVRGIYRHTTGWLDDDPAHADPSPPGARSRELVALAGGPEVVLERARALHDEGQHQLAMELASTVLEVAPANREAHLLKAACCEALVATSSSINWRGFYRAGAFLERYATGEPLPDLPIEMVPVQE